MELSPQPVQYNTSLRFDHSRSAQARLLWATCATIGLLTYSHSAYAQVCAGGQALDTQQKLTTSDGLGFTSVRLGTVCLLPTAPRSVTS